LKVVETFCQDQHQGQYFYSKTKTKTLGLKTKTIFCPRDQDFGLEDYITEKERKDGSKNFHLSLFFYYNLKTITDIINTYLIHIAPLLVKHIKWRHKLGHTWNI